MTTDPLVTIACAGLSHHEADIATMEQFRFRDTDEFLREAGERFRGVLLLQTCNRIEIVAEGNVKSLSAFLEEKGRSGFWTLEGTDVLSHLLELASGMDSMVIGEDQILGQMKEALSESMACDVCGTILETCITKAVHTGIEVRKRTRINNGAVSVGSAAVELAEELLGSLEGRHILVVGGGEMGQLVTQALAAKRLKAIYVTNRTYERAVTLAAKVGGKAVHLDELYHYLPLADVIISCTSAPHPIIKRNDVEASLDEQTWPLDETPRTIIIIDIAQPRDVEESVGDIECVHLFSIDDLRTVSQKNLDIRRKEAEQAQLFIESEIENFICLLRRIAVNETLAQLHTWGEAIRVRERDRALSRLQCSDERTAGIIDDLTKVLVKKLIADATFSVRASAECGDKESAEMLVKAIVRGERICIQKEE